MEGRSPTTGSAASWENALQSLARSTQERLETLRANAAAAHVALDEIREAALRALIDANDKCPSDAAGVEARITELRSSVDDETAKKTNLLESELVAVDAALVVVQRLDQGLDGGGRTPDEAVAAALGPRSALPLEPIEPDILRVLAEPGPRLATIFAPRGVTADDICIGTMPSAALVGLRNFEISLVCSDAYVGDIAFALSECARRARVTASLDLVSCGSIGTALPMAATAEAAAEPGLAPATPGAETGPPVLPVTFVVSKGAVRALVALPAGVPLGAEIIMSAITLHGVPVATPSPLPVRIGITGDPHLLCSTAFVRCGCWTVALPGNGSDSIVLWNAVEPRSPAWEAIEFVFTSVGWHNYERGSASGTAWSSGTEDDSSQTFNGDQPWQESREEVVLGAAEFDRVISACLKTRTAYVRRQDGIEGGESSFTLQQGSGKVRVFSPDGKTRLETKQEGY
jgi:hypothetical protein